MNPTPKILQSELNRGEKLLWWGQPAPIRAFLPTLPIFLFAIPWTAFACFWMLMAVSGVSRAGHTPAGAFAWIFPLFGLPFIFVGFGMVSIPLKTYLKAKRTFYAITDVRLLIVTNGKTKTIENYDFKGLSNLVRTEYGDRGDLSWTVLNPRMAPTSSGFLPNGRNTLTNTVTLFGIKEPRKIEKLVEDFMKLGPQKENAN